MSVKKILLLVALIPMSVFAFKPSVSYWPFWSNVNNNHLTITEEGIRSIGIDGKDLIFEDNALNDVKKANANVDNTEADIHSAHCDAEAIGGNDGCSNRLVILKNEVISILLQKNPNIAMARKKLGQALHTLQDFYAHSNWVNLKRTTPYR